MIIVMNRKATKEQVKKVEEKLSELGYHPHTIQGEERQVIGAVGKQQVATTMGIATLEGVESVVPISTPYQLVSREANKEGSVVSIGGVKIGGKELAIMAGPCAVESYQQLQEVGEVLRSQGVKILRGGAYKPRTSPYSFQGLEQEGLEMLHQVSREKGLKTVTEVMSPGDVETVADYVDMLQVGARNMQNYPLLREVGQGDKPVLLKRGMSSDIEEWLMAAEYILMEGNSQVVLCERGIKTFEKYTRNTLDISAVPLAKDLSHLPVVVDPSHSGGSWKLVSRLSKAAISAGGDGLLVEVHPSPAEAWCDGSQSLNFDNFVDMLYQLERVAEAVGRKVSGSDKVVEKGASLS